MAERKSNRATTLRQLLTVAEAAEILSTSDKNVRRWIKRGELRAIKIGRLVRIDPRDLEDFIRDRRTR
jgi:excisionase family DNA binding protein